MMVADLCRPYGAAAGVENHIPRMPASASLRVHPGLFSSPPYGGGSYSTVTLFAKLRG